MQRKALTDLQDQLTKQFEQFEQQQQLEDAQKSKEAVKQQAQQQQMLEQFQQQQARFLELQVRLEQQHEVQRKAFEEGTKDSEARSRFFQCGQSGGDSKEDTCTSSIRSSCVPGCVSVEV